MFRGNSDGPSKLTFKVSVQKDLIRGQSAGVQTDRHDGHRYLVIKKNQMQFHLIICFIIDQMFENKEIIERKR